MKWYHTLFFKITLIFSITLVTIVGIGGFFIKYQNGKNLVEAQKALSAILRSSYDKKIDKFDEEFLGQEGIFLLKDTSMYVDFIEKELVEFKNHHSMMGPPNQGMGKRRHAVMVFSHQGDIFALANYKRPTLFKTSYTTNANLHAAVFIFLLFLIIALYFLTIRSIRPLISLRKSIEALSEGKYMSIPPIKSKDEIGELTRAYHEMVEKMKQLKDARVLFLRNVMHELKTPLTKARLVLAMMEESLHKEKLKDLMGVQESLLEEFARIEKLGAGEQRVDVKKYHIDDILAQVLDLLPDEEPNLTIEVESGFLSVDFDLFCVGLKNIVDNALRYSLDKSAKFSFKDGVILVENRGNPLKYSLEEHRQPYFLGGQKQRESRGFGFGLFIALRVFDLHEFTTTYTHDGEISRFLIKI